MKKLLFLLSCLFFLSSCSAAEHPAAPKEVPDPFFENASVVLQWEDRQLSGNFSFSSEQLFHFYCKEPAALQGARYDFSPAESRFSFAGLTQDSPPSDAPAFLFYRALCTMMQKEIFTETESGFIASPGDEPFSVLCKEDTLTLITTNLKAVIFLNQNRESPELLS